MPQMCHVRMGYDAAIRFGLARMIPKKWEPVFGKIMRKGKR
jgi:hypothetical protein